MIRFESAKLLDAMELKELLDEEYSNPTVERLMFLECKAANGQMKIFPCFIRAYTTATEAAPPAADNPMPLGFDVYIVQALSGGDFGMVRVYMLTSDLGVKMRVWDKPPTSANQRETPWVVQAAEGVQ